VHDVRATRQAIDLDRSLATHRAPNQGVHPPTRAAS
jgi:hypothetical protein